MTEVATMNPAAVASAPQPRSIVRQLARGVVVRWGARIGLVWIALLVLAAVFAPLIANSHPLVMKDAAGISSPWLKHLTVSDCMIASAFFAALVLWRLKIRWKLLWFAGAVVVAGVVSGTLVQTRYTDLL